MIKKNNLLQTNDKEVKELKDAIENFNKHNFFENAESSNSQSESHYSSSHNGSHGS